MPDSSYTKVFRGFHIIRIAILMKCAQFVHERYLYHSGQNLRRLSMQQKKTTGNLEVAIWRKLWNFETLRNRDVVLREPPPDLLV